MIDSTVSFQAVRDYQFMGEWEDQPSVFAPVQSEVEYYEQYEGNIF